MLTHRILCAGKQVYCIIWPHHSTSQMQPIATYGVAWSVSLSVMTISPAKNGWTEQDAIWHVNSGVLKELCIRWGTRSPHGKGHFWGNDDRIFPHRWAPFPVALTSGLPHMLLTSILISWPQKQLDVTSNFSTETPLWCSLIKIVWP